MGSTAFACSSSLKTSESEFPTMTVRLRELRRPLRHMPNWCLLCYLTAGLLSTIALAWASTWIGATNPTTAQGFYADHYPGDNPNFGVTRSFGSELAEFDINIGWDVIPGYLSWLPSKKPSYIEPPYWSVARLQESAFKNIWAEGAHG